MSDLVFQMKLPTDRPLDVQEVRIAGQLVPGMSFRVDVGEDLTIVQLAGQAFTGTVDIRWVEGELRSEATSPADSKPVPTSEPSP